MTAPCNVACGSGIVTVNSPSGSTLQCDMWLWDDMPYEFAQTSTVGSLHMVSISIHHRSRHVILYQSAKFYPNRTTLGGKKMTSCRFSRWRISAILDCSDGRVGRYTTHLNHCPISIYVLSQHHLLLYLNITSCDY